MNLAMEEHFEVPKSLLYGTFKNWLKKRSKKSGFDF